MKIKLLLTAMATATVLAGVAQPGSFTPDSIKLIKQRQGIRAGENKAPGILIQKSFSLSSRVTGLVFARYNGAYYQPLDSISLKYSKNNGGDLNSEWPKYDVALVWLYDDGTGTYSELQRLSQSFDVNNNVSVQLAERWDAGSTSWVNLYRELYTYDSKNNMLGYIDQDWNTITGAWVNNYRYTYTYNSNNMQLTETDQYWKASASQWKNQYKYTNTFNTGNELTSQLYQAWNDADNTWDNRYLSLYTYDSGNMLTYIEQNWDDSLLAWNNRVKYSYTYDGNNNETVALEQIWNQNSSNWKNDNQHLYTYGAQKNLLNDVYQEWGSGAWKNQWQDIYTYNNTNDRITTTQQDWSSQQSAWKNMYFDSSAYDNRHNEIMRLMMDWKNADSAFVNDREIDFTYNQYDQLTSETATTWNAGGFWQPTTSDMQERFYYEEYGETGIRQTTATAGNTTVYPSPAKNIVNIDLQWNKDQAATIGVYDAQGRLLNQLNVVSTKDSHTTLPVMSLPAGVYILKIRGEYDQAYKQFTVVH